MPEEVSLYAAEPGRVPATSGLFIRSLARGNALSDHERAWIEEGLVRGLPELKIREYLAATPGWFNDWDFFATATHGSSGSFAGVAIARFHSEPFAFVHITTLLIAQRFRG